MIEATVPGQGAKGRREPVSRHDVPLEAEAKAILVLAQPPGGENARSDLEPAEVVGDCRVLAAQGRPDSRGEPPLRGAQPGNSRLQTRGLRRELGLPGNPVEHPRAERRQAGFPGSVRRFATVFGCPPFSGPGAPRGRLPLRFPRSLPRMMIPARPYCCTQKQAAARALGARRALRPPGSSRVP